MTNRTPAEAYRQAAQIARDVRKQTGNPQFEDLAKHYEELAGLAEKPIVRPPLAIQMADEYLTKHRVSETWRLIDMLRDALVRAMDRTPPTRTDYEPVSYMDGTPVKPGDRIRYQQASGGLLPPGETWRYGIAVVASDEHTWPGRRPTLLMQADEGGLYNIVGHIIERSDR